MKRVAVYLRQSQDRSGEQLGIDRQREDVHQLCKSRRWKDLTEFVDNDVSATSRKPRPAFVEMMSRVDAGEFDVIVSRHMDRLLRRLSELESVLERCEKAGAFVVTASDGVDTSTDGGRLVARILSSVAQGEVERKSARQRSAVVQAAKAGKRVSGRRAFGYEPDGVTIRKPEAALIRQGYADILAGESLGEVARRWSASKFTTTQSNEKWLRHSVKDVLTNPRNCGLRRHRTADTRRDIRSNPELGIVGKAEWPGIVDEQTWRAAVRLLCDPSRLRPHKVGRALLTGVGVCGVCGEHIHVAGSRGGQNYRCSSGRHFNRQAAPINELVEKAALVRLKDPRTAKLWSGTDVSKLLAEADVLRSRLTDLAEDYTRMTRDQWRIANDKATARLAEVEARIAAAGSGSDTAARVASAKDPAAEWARLTVAQKRKIINAILTVTVHPMGHGGRFTPESVTVTPK